MKFCSTKQAAWTILGVVFVTLALNTTFYQKDTAPVVVPDVSFGAVKEYRVLVKTDTLEIIPDFQGKPKAGVLLDNAIRAGLGTIDNLEERVVTEQEYTDAKQVWMDSVKPAKDAAKSDKKTRKDVLIKKAKRSWSNEHLTELENLILDGVRLSNDPTR